MRAFLVFLLLAVLGACAPHPQSLTISPPSHEVDASALAQKTVALVATTEDGSQHTFCSGVWVSPTTILTAHHCVADWRQYDPVSYAVPADVFGSNHEQRSKFETHLAVVLANDEKHDLALLRAILAPSHLVATLDDAPIAPGQFCQVMGHSLGMLMWSYSSGDIAAVRKLVVDEGDSPDLTWIQATVPISPGNSGGGLFDANGNLIGITSATFRRGQNLNVFIHRMHITAFLRSLS